MSRPTLLLATPYFPPEGGGLEMYAQHVAKRLQADHSWRTVLITSQPGPHDVVREEHGIKIYGLSYRWRLSNTPFDPAWYAKIRRIITAEQPDLINVHTPVPGLPNLAVSAAGKRPVVVTYHAGSLKKGGTPLDMPIWMYEHSLLPRMLQRADRIICSSDWVRLGFLAAYQDKSLTLTTAVDPQVFRPAEQWPKHPHVICLGGLHAAETHKGLSTILRAAAQLQQSALPELRLTIVGEGDSRAHFEQEAQRLGLHHTTFAGRLAPPDNAVAFRRGTVFALPTAKDSLPTVLMEALSTGLPVVTTDVGSITDLITDGENGVIIPPNDPDALAKAIAGLHADPARVRTISQANRRKILDNYSWQHMAERTNNVFRDVLATHRRNRA